MREPTPKTAGPAGPVQERELAEASIEPITAGQVKRLGEIGLSLIPADITKGFAQKLVNGDFLRFVGGVIAEKRLEWRRENSRLNFVMELKVPGNHGGTVENWIAQRERSLHDGSLIKYLGDKKAAFSVSNRQYQPTGNDDRVFVYRASDEIEQPRMIEVLGGRDAMSDYLHFNPLCVSPLQAISLMDAGRVEYHKEKILFLVGQHQNRPLFLETWRGGEHDLWGYREEWWDEPADCRGENTLFVFGAHPF